MSCHEMLSYRRKPWIDGSCEIRTSCEPGFTRSNSRNNGSWSSSRRCGGSSKVNAAPVSRADGRIESFMTTRGSPSSFSSSKTKSINNSCKGYTRSCAGETLRYGHKPSGDGTGEIKASYERGFTHSNSGKSGSCSRCGGSGKVKDASMSRVSDRTEDGSSRGRARKTSNFKKMNEADDASERGCRMSSWEMLCYGHKPWDDDYWEWKEIYEKTFTECRSWEGKTQDASYTEYGNKACDSTSESDGSVRNSMRSRMRFYLRDDDYWEWKEFYEKTFTECRSWEGKTQDASNTEYGNKPCDFTSEGDADDARGGSCRMSRWETVSYGQKLLDNEREMLSYEYEPWDTDHWSGDCSETSDCGWESDSDD